LLRQLSASQRIVPCVSPGQLPAGQLHLQFNQLSGGLNLGFGCGPLDEVLAFIEHTCDGVAAGVLRGKGFAQIELEKIYPGVTAMFFQGAGADQNPLPRRTIQLARQYGKELAASVERVLGEDMKKLDPMLSTAYSEVNLPFSAPPPADTLLKIVKEKEGYQKSWASNQLRALRDNGSLITSYPYPVQVWKLGDQAIMALGGELVVGYSTRLKKLFGQDIFVLGYVNDDMAYIPTETILNEGGYEGESSQMVYGMPAKWASGIEAMIIEEMKKLALKTGVKQISE